MSMLGFVYLVLILGWIMIVLFLKCKKTISPHLTLAENYTDAIGTDRLGRRPSVHVIQLPTNQRRSEDEIISTYHERSNTLRQHSQRSERSTLEERFVETYPTDAVINPAYQHDDEYIINAPPPSYDEVMRQPNIYPKVNQQKCSDENI